MPSLSALLVDDEEPARSLLREMLGEHPEVRVLGEAASGEEALRLVRQLAPDVVFLDVQMPGLTGVEVAARLGREARPPRVVFVTAYDEYAVQAFDLEAMDYLVKPVEPERLARTLRRLERSPGDPEAVDRLLRAVDALAGLDRLSLLDEVTGVRHVVDLGKVRWITSREDRTYVRVGAEDLRCLETLAVLEERLPRKRFLRTHRAYLVNVDQVEAVVPWSHGSYNLRMRGTGEEVPLSRRYAAAFKERVGWL